ncbi:MAG: hypothetical protein KatS3mg040_0136 [Candidatus Kapaibacterium sp.]|nr:MAG: hypothetical protein KatS3mg040_0136 [Candidatus Kapabacteria bacterium]
MNLYAYREGISGVSSTGCGGNGCHGSQPSSLTTIILDGPRLVKPNTLNSFTLRVRHSSAIYAGFNMAAFTKEGQPSGLLQYPQTESQYVKSLNGELTHRARRTMSNQGSYREAAWQVQWRSPETPGEYVIRVAGNAADGDGRASAGDMWNVLPPVTITVQGIILTTPTTSNAYCSGDTITLQWTSYGVSTANILYSADSGRSWILLGSVQSQVGVNTYRYVVPPTVTAGTKHLLRIVDGDDELLNATTPPLTLNPRTTIRTQPSAPPTQCEGATVALSIAATGGNLRYQWKHNGTPLPGATATQLQLTNLQVRQSGEYTCEVTGACGIVTSTPVMLTVVPKPTITSQSSDTTVREGTRLELHVAATPDSGCTYQWFKNGASISGATDSRYVLESTSTGDAGTYAVLIRNACGTVESSPIRVQVTPLVSVEEETAAVGVRLYPQPAAHTATIESPLPIRRIIVYDTKGRVVRWLDCSVSDATKLELSLRDEHGAPLAHGVYLVGCQLAGNPVPTCHAPATLERTVWRTLLIE